MSISADWNMKTADEKNEENIEILLGYMICSKEKKNNEEEKDPSWIRCSQHVPLDFDL